MTERFTTDPHQMRIMASRFAGHAQSIEDEARRIQASAPNSDGARQASQAFRNIVNMLHGVRDELTRDANSRQE